MFCYQKVCFAIKKYVFSSKSKLCHEKVSFAVTHMGYCGICLFVWQLLEGRFGSIFQLGLSQAAPKMLLGGGCSLEAHHTNKNMGKHLGLKVSEYHQEVATKWRWLLLEV